MPQQAVILCGGLGTRLRPLTDNMPKPMAPVNGKPFLHHLIEQVRDQGIRRILLLTGYRSEMIREYFGVGEKLGVEISYSSGPAEWDTGRRLWEAREQMEPRFLLLYSDNFVQFNLPRLGRLHRQHGMPVSLLLAPKEKGNIRVSSAGKIEAYAKLRSGEGFDYVEVGYMLVERDQVLAGFPGCSGFPDFNFSALLEEYAGEAKIAGLVVRDPYHSISDIKRLQLMRDYLSPKKILLIDRDGTINRKAPRGEYIAGWDRFEWVADTVEAMKNLANKYGGVFEAKGSLDVENTFGPSTSHYRLFIDLDLLDANIIRITPEMKEKILKEGIQSFGTGGIVESGIKNLDISKKQTTGIVGL